MSMPSPTPRFGVEIECILEIPGLPDRDDEKTRAMERLTEKHNKGCIHQMQNWYVKPIDETRGHGYENWTIVKDTSIMGAKHGDVALELVSPIFCAGEGLWQTSIEEVFNSLSSIGEIKTNATCGTHVHLSHGSGGPWPLEELKRISLAILYFEPVLVELLPSSRRYLADTTIGLSNAKQQHFKNKSLAERWAIIDGTVMPVANDDSKHAKWISTVMSPKKTYLWNYQNLNPGKKGTGYTIEFRMPPGVAYAVDCRAWIRLAVGFVESAVRNGKVGILESYTPDLSGLKTIIRSKEGGHEDQFWGRVLSQRLNC